MGNMGAGAVDCGQQLKSNVDRLLGIGECCDQLAGHHACPKYNHTLAQHVLHAIYPTCLILCECLHVFSFMIDPMWTFCTNRLFTGSRQP